MTIRTASNAAELQAAIASAASGDVILLEDGDYGSLVIRDRLWTDWVTIKPVHPDGDVQFTNVAVLGSSHVRIDGVHVDNPSNGSAASKLVAVDGGSTHVQFLNSEVNGRVDDEYQGWYGLFAGDASDVLFEGNFVHDVKNGLVALGPDNITVRSNTFDHLGNDAMKFAGVDGVVIENNTGARNVHPTADAHLDFIQFQGSSQNIVIQGNLSLPESQVTSQGIFFGGGTYDNVTISDNIVINALNRAISIGAGSNIEVYNNTVLTVPGYGHKAALIITPAGSSVYNNISAHVASHSGPSGSNLVVQWDQPGSSNYYDDIYVNASRGFGITIEDLTPVPGSAGETLGAYQRIAELLDTSGAGIDANDDAFVVAEDQVLVFSADDLTANDESSTGGSLSIASIEQPSHGTVTQLADGSFAYSPDADFAGTDSFQYTVTDGAGGRDVGTVTITVDPVNDDPPKAADDAVVVRTDTATVIDVLANDSDPDGDPLSITSFTTPSNGTLVDNGDGTFTYTPDAGFTGTDAFRYTVDDGTGRTDTANVAITVEDLPTPILKEGSNSFDGSTQSAVILPHAAAYELAEGTIELSFITETVAPARQGLLTKDAYSFGDGGHLAVFLLGDDLQVRMQDADGETAVRIADVVTPGVEHDLALTFGPGGLDVYLDGVRVGGNASWTHGLQGNAEPIVIGANQWSSSAGSADNLRDPFTGTVSRFNLYDEALDAGEIASLAGLASLGGSTNEPSHHIDVAGEDGGNGGVIYAHLGEHLFSGSADDVIQIPHSAAFEVASATLSLSFEADDLDGMQGLFSKDAKHYVGGGNHFTAYLNGSTLNVRLQDGRSEQTIQIPGIEADREYALVTSFGPGGAAVWLDDQLVASSDFVMNWEQNLQAVQIGANGWASSSGSGAFGDVFTGTLSKVLIAEGIWSPDEIAALTADRSSAFISANPNGIDAVQPTMEFSDFL